MILPIQSLMCDTICFWHRICTFLLVGNPIHEEKTELNAMAATQAVSQSVRISVNQALARLQAGEEITFLDARAPEAWDKSNEKIRGAIRAPLDNFQPDPSWPKDQLVISYCT